MTRTAFLRGAVFYTTSKIIITNLTPLTLKSTIYLERLFMNLPEISPLKPVKANKIPEGEHLSYEIKYDGFRSILYYEGGIVKMISKQNLPLTYPQLSEEIISYLKRKKVQDLILDGEICSFDESGKPNLKKLLGKRGKIKYVAFDCLWLNGENLKYLSLQERRKILYRVIPETLTEPFRTAIHQENNPRELLEGVIKNNLEGIVVKCLDDSYVKGVKWYKIKP